MPATAPLVQLGQLVAATHGWAQARAFKTYRWSDQDRADIASCASKIIPLFAPHAGRETSLSATLAFQLQRHLQAPVHLVAGTLRVDGHAVLADRMATDGVSPFAADGPNWRGHLWIMVGAYVVDVSIFRLATSPDCPPALARHIHLAFGPDKGLYADHWRHARRVGLEYEPQYVLSGKDMDHLLADAYRLIDDGAR